MKRARLSLCEAESSATPTATMPQAHLLPEILVSLDSAFDAPQFTHMATFIAWHTCCHEHYMRYTTQGWARRAAILEAKWSYAAAHTLDRVINARVYANWAIIHQQLAVTRLCDYIFKLLPHVSRNLSNFVMADASRSPFTCSQHLCLLSKLEPIIGQEKGRMSRYGVQLLSKAREWIRRHHHWVICLYHGDRLPFPWDYKTLPKNDQITVSASLI